MAPSGAVVAKIEILARRRLPAVDRARLGKFDRYVTYRVDEDPRQVHSLILPDESWSEISEQTAITQHVKDQQSGILRTFST